MDKLPSELLFKILLYVPPMDRLNCSLTCRRWAEAMTSSQLLRDVWLDISGHEMETASSLVVNSQRQYTNLVLCRADLSEWDSEFWRKIGDNLRALELQYCSWSSRVFYGILQRCPKLESLKIVDDYPRKISIDDFVPPEGACHEELRDSLSHLRHLHLGIKLIVEVLDLLLGLMPNVTSISVSSLFDRESDFLKRLSSVLEKYQISRTGADFRDIAIGSEELIKFVEITSGSLEELRIDKSQVTERASNAIFNCTKLRSLTLEARSLESLQEKHLEKLVSNSPDLKILELHYIQKFRLKDEDKAHLLKLKKLRTLSLRCYRRTRFTNRVLYRLGEMSTLVELHLRGFSVDSRVMRSLGCLKNLRSFVIGECVNSQCFEAICENFERLTELDLGEVHKLTDADGSKLCRFKELLSLSFRWGYGFTDLTFERGVGSRAMKSLFIDGCSLTSAGLRSIASHHDRLKTLILGDCKNITDAGVLALVQNQPRLKELYVGGYAKMRLKDEVVRNLCSRLRALRIQCD